MGKLAVFNSVSLDGYFTDKNSDIIWAHGAPDAEFDAFVAGNFSKRMKKAAWNNSRVMPDDLVGEVRKLQFTLTKTKSFSNGKLFNKYEKVG